MVRPIGVLLALILGSIEAHTADQVPYDPAACRTDAKGKRYVALGHTVFALAPQTQLIGQRLSPETLAKPLPPPDPRQPEGCPGNPEQVQSIGLPPPLPYHWMAELNRPGHPTDNSGLGVRGVGLGVAADVIWSGRRGKPLGDEIASDADLHLARQMRAPASVHEELPSGLMACSLKPATPSEPLVYAEAYIAHPDDYTTPLGKPFAINCVAQSIRVGLGWCRVTYRYSHDFTVHYEFDPVPPGAHLPIDRVIDFDRRLRDEIVQLIVPDPRWRDTPSGPPGSR